MKMPLARAAPRKKSGPGARQARQDPKTARAARGGAARPGDELLGRLGARVRALRESRAQSRRALARASGISERFLADLESGAGNISLARLSALCGALGSGIAELLAEAEESGSLGSAPRAPQSHRSRRSGELHAALEQLAPEQQREALAWIRAQFGATRRPLVALLGLRGAGKSTIGRALARRLGVRFIELDARVEEAAGLTLAGIFSMHGEEYYRRLARELLAQLLADGEGAVIATGGSLVTDTQSLRLLLRRCRTVWLRATPEDHWRRVLAQGDERPSAASGNAQAELRALLQARSPLYAQAELTVDTSRLGVAGSVEAVLRAL